MITNKSGVLVMGPMFGYMGGDKQLIAENAALGAS
jgi:hypothetical protein